MQERIRCFKWFLNNVILSTLIVCIVLVIINICLSYCKDMQRNLYSSRSDICVREIININDQSAFCCNQLNYSRTILFTGFFSPLLLFTFTFISLLLLYKHSFKLIRETILLFVLGYAVCVYIYIYTHTHTHTHTHMLYIYIYTYIYTYITDHRGPIIREPFTVLC